MSLSSIKGTGPEGSVLKADVEEYLGDYFNFCIYDCFPSMCVCIGGVHGGYSGFLA